MNDDSAKPDDSSPAFLPDEGPTEVPDRSSSRVLGLAGKELGHYRLIEEIGHGGQGYVYLADDLKIHRQVALKILPQGQMLSPSARLRFEREAEAAGKLDHPGISRIYECGEQEGILFIAMELVRGKTLSKLISETTERASSNEEITEIYIDFEEEPAENKPSPSPTQESSSTSADRDAIMGAVRFIESAAQALHAAHEQGLVHRDVKPGNLMVRDDGSACVLDFGLAQDDQGMGVTITQTGDLMGTPAYMSPEQLLTDRLKLDRRTDIYSLGVCLFEACTLERPFKGRSAQELYEAISQREPTAPRRINPKIPKDLEAIILTAMDKSRERRYPTALAFSEDLRRFRSFEPVEARPAGTIVKTTRWVQRNPFVAASALVVFVALLVSSIVFYVKGEEARRARERADQQAGIAKEESRQRGIALAEKESALQAETRERKAKEAALAEKDSALTEKTKALSDYDRLADVKRLEAAIEASERLYPPSPQLVAKLEGWQRKHGSVAGRLEDHRKFIAELREKALPYSDEERKRDFAAELIEFPQATAAIVEIGEELAAAEDEDEKSSLRARISAIEKRAAELEVLLTGRRSWHLEDQAFQFQHDVLAELVTNLESFANDETGPLKSVARRLEASQAIAKETLEGAMAARWQACRERIKKNEHYSGLDLAPQLGLISLGPDPDSGLEEFLHWLSHEGEIPTRNPSTGKIAVTEDLGVVLVMIPGGSFMMGAQKDDPSKLSYDPEAQSNEQPVNKVTLSAYLLSKYEMTVTVA